MFYTVDERVDGFGAQFQTIIYCILIAENTGNTYIHRRIRTMEHNYYNDPQYLSKVELLMNVSDNYKNINDTSLNETIISFNPHKLIYNFESNINFLLNSESLIKLKTNFWKNKNRNIFNNDAFNIAIHIRSKNLHDITLDSNRSTPLKYYFNIIELIKKNNINSKKLIFHIYSQNDMSDYDEFDKEGLCFHLNENMFDTFTGLVAADILVTSRSSFSYTAAILSDGIIYYQPFWHPPGEKWIRC
jgi:hypothetical protein